MYMQVREFLDLFINPEDQYFKLYDNYTEKIIFEGCLLDIPESMKYLEYAEITSIDNIHNGEPLTLNVDVDKSVID